MTYTLQNKLGAWALSSLMLLGTMAVVSVPTLSTTGCTFTSVANEIGTDAVAAAKAALQIATAAESEYPTLAAQITKYANDVYSAGSALLNGTTTEAKVVSALEALEGILSAVPSGVTQAIAAALPIVIAAIEAIYAFAGSKTSVTEAKLRVAAPLKSAWSGKAQIHHQLLRSTSGDFKAAWNEQVVKAYPQSGFVAI